MAAGADGGRWWIVGAVSLVVPPLVIDCYGSSWRCRRSGAIQAG